MLMIRKLLPGLIFLCTIIPVWARSQNKDVLLTKLCDRFYVHITKSGGVPANGLIAETDHGVILIDTGWDTARTRELLQQVQEQLHKPVLLCIISHCHIDRLGGAAVLQEHHIKTISTPLTASLAVKEGYIPPAGILPNDTTFTIDGLQLTTYYPGAGHAKDNIVVWFPAKRVLFGGCFVKSMEANDLGNVADADVQQWPVSIKKVQERFPEPAWVIPGHQGWGSNKAMEHTLQLLAK